MIAFEKCFTGRKWINIGSGWFAIGFGRWMVVERIMIKGVLVYARGFK